jgi:hypothetical protein
VHRVQLKTVAQAAQGQLAVIVRHPRHQLDALILASS